MIITKTEAQVKRNASSKNSEVVEAIVKILHEDLVNQKAEASQVSVADLQETYPDLKHFDSSILNKVKSQFSGYSVAGRDTQKFETAKDASKFTSRITRIVAFK